jgi:uncharacterized protein (TIGR00106 family)
VEAATMKVTAMFSLIPIGTEVSLSRYIAACEGIVRESGLVSELHAHGTNVEGDWEDVFGVIRRCVEKVHEMGAVRVATMIKLGTRTDRDPSMARMVESVEEKLGLTN